MREIIFCVIFYSAAIAAKEGNVSQKIMNGYFHAQLSKRYILDPMLVLKNPRDLFRKMRSQRVSNARKCSLLEM